eukprot:CAMPEP_0174694408 /NCGR_PEP_ID=MMETSP1094-20130205/1025_1 /TAXON_ID=156173 /ORGANISM="Chrysochromulina brevifilum, Strain UTEX LB 985" /LENGTH=282 /DNA_ID=CAMNT_0015890653 /DNA_START=280 /DNA_END=1132 /DNA_ORIENTATION=+
MPWIRQRIWCCACTLRPFDDALCPAPCTLRPAPCVLRPVLIASRSTPCPAALLSSRSVLLDGTLPLAFPKRLGGRGVRRWVEPIVYGTVATAGAHLMEPASWHIEHLAGLKSDEESEAPSSSGWLSPPPAPLPPCPSPCLPPPLSCPLSLARLAWLRMRSCAVRSVIRLKLGGAARASGLSAAEGAIDRWALAFLQALSWITAALTAASMATSSSFSASSTAALAVAAADTTATLAASSAVAASSASASLRSARRCAFLARRSASAVQSTWVRPSGVVEISP